MGTVKGVLFDSGGVLIRPIGGRWNPRLDFEPTVLALAPHLTEADFRRAIEVGEQYWGSVSPAAHTRDDYHRTMLVELGVAPTDPLLADLGRPLDPSTIVEPYPEVIAVLQQLQASGIRMAVVSDNSPGLERLHAGVGIAHFFEAYAISAVLGCTKPDPRMYVTRLMPSASLRPSACSSTTCPISSPPRSSSAIEARPCSEATNRPRPTRPFPASPTSPSCSPSCSRSARSAATLDVECIEVDYDELRGIESEGLRLFGPAIRIHSASTARRTATPTPK